MKGRKNAFTAFYIVMIGRKKQIEELENLYNSKKSELIAVYGRRRVGKTYLIDKTFETRLTFRHTGLSPLENIDEKAKLQSQLNHFVHSLNFFGYKDFKKPKTWLEAFYLLEDYLLTRIKEKRLVVFLDELPWLDTPKSGFMTAFEAFWNGFACHYDNIMVIVCGSSSSWIINKLINNHGGLYARLTYEMKLTPFDINECEQYFILNDVKLSRYDIAQCYMILGGIPYYLNYIKKGMTLPQAIDRMFFLKEANLKDEFDRLFSATFNNPEEIKRIIRLLNSKKIGLTRNEILEGLNVSDGGTFNEYLKSLIESDFIIKYVPYLENKRKVYYKLVDPFCLFYLRFVENKNSLYNNFWQENIDNQSVIIWRGLAFENLCFNHISIIKELLGISGVKTNQSLWYKKGNDNEKGFQIDLMIERNDNVLSVCEAKFYKNSYTLNKDYYLHLLDRDEQLTNIISKKISIHNVLITTFGLKNNEYSNYFDKVIVLDDLFK